MIPNPLLHGLSRIDCLAVIKFTREKVVSLFFAANPDNINSHFQLKYNSNRGVSIKQFFTTILKINGTFNKNLIQMEECL